MAVLKSRYAFYAFANLKCASLCYLSCKNVQWHPPSFTLHKGASKGKVRAHSQVYRHPSYVSLVAVVK